MASDDDVAEGLVAVGAGGGNGDARRRRRRPTAASSLLAGSLHRSVRRFGFADARLVTDWATIVGSEIAEVAVPVRLDRRGRRLTLHVRPAAALLLQHQEPQVLERINAFFGGTLVLRLHLVQTLAASRPEPPPVRRALDDADHAAIEAAVSAVGPPALRSALASLGRHVRADGR